jgi:hypothetical protein
MRDSDNFESRANYGCLEARLLRAHGRPAEALAAAERALATLGDVGITDAYIKRVLVEACEAALALGDRDKAGQLLVIPESLDPGERTPMLQAQALRLRARLDAAGGLSERVDERFLAAAALFREFAFVFYEAVTQLEHAEWLIGQGGSDDAEALLGEARRTFERLEAAPWLERVATASRVRPAQVSV